jgi:hypothetical protein
MKFISALLFTTSLLAASIQENGESCTGKYASCSHTDPTVLRNCENGKYVDYKCEQGAKCILRGSNNNFAECE